jgi:glycosyltransferase involved in cell wall biosynthesis
VIPNKVFQALACGAPVITSDTEAARELLVDGESAILVPPGDSSALAAAVRRLAQDGSLAKRVADGGRRIYEQRASERVLGERWRGLLERLVA